jgi:hypothetical protein
MLQLYFRSRLPRKAESKEHKAVTGYLVPCVLFLVVCALCLLGACDLTPASGGLRAFPTATALGKSVAVNEPGADNSRGSSIGTPASGRTVGRSTIPPLLTSTPTPSATITPGTPLPTGTPTITLTPFATPTRYRTPTEVLAPPTVTPAEGAPAGGGASEGSPTPLSGPTGNPVPAAPRPTTRPGLPTPPAGSGPLPPIAVDVGQAASRNGVVFIVTRVDKSPKRVDVIYSISNQTGSAIAFNLTNADQRLLRGGTVKGPADPGGAASITLQNGQNYDSGTTFFISAENPNGDDLIFSIDRLPRIGSVRVRIPA